MRSLSLILLTLVTATGMTGAPAAIRVEYPAAGSVFPPDFAAPAFLFHDPAPQSDTWRIEVRFAGGGAPLRAECRCGPMRLGEIDPRAVAETNRLPELTARQRSLREWRPGKALWEAIQKRSVERTATVTMNGFQGGRLVSSGWVAISTSKDPVGAPVFYRDVPLMPSELEEGVIKPLAPAAVPLIAWRLKDVSKPGSRVVMEGLHTCANCHSFSRDGSTLGMDVDGPRNHKGLYTLVKTGPRMTIRDEDVIEWSSFRGKTGGSLRVGFMSQVSPDGQSVVTMIDPPGRTGGGQFYVANFKDYRFLQVFYPTRGILAWYSRKTGVLQPLHGADDPRFVQTNAVWSPDGSYLVFARSAAGDPYDPARPAAGRANDPNETQIRYDLYRVPFDNGRGGTPEPIAGASGNGVSNSFPKISPDGRWIVFVQAANGLLMRPDSKLYIVPAAGGAARPLNANLPLMNSWHSFSPNGRWLVFSSKSRSPYTQMYLTHIDEQGRDTPAILVENATAANRAVNIPEFVNIPPDGIEQIEVPVAEFYRRCDEAFALTAAGRYAEAVGAWQHALELSPSDARARMNLGMSLLRAGRLEEAAPHLEHAVASGQGSAEAYLNLGLAMAMRGRTAEAIAYYRRSISLDGGTPEAHSNLGAALLQAGRAAEAIAEYRRAVELNPRFAEVHNNLGAALARMGQLDAAIVHFRRAVELKPEFAPAQNHLGRALLARGQTRDAIPCFEAALRANPDYLEAHANLAEALMLVEDATRALAHWREVLRLDPNHARAREAVREASKRL